MCARSGETGLKPRLVCLYHGIYDLESIGFITARWRMYHHEFNPQNRTLHTSPCTRTSTRHYATNPTRSKPAPYPPLTPEITIVFASPVLKPLKSTFQLFDTSLSQLYPVRGKLTVTAAPPLTLTDARRSLLPFPWNVYATSPLM